MQDRLTYANGNTITTEGFKCVVGEPIDIIAYEDTPFSHNAVIDVRKQMLVTLEVDGEIVCYRELHDFEIVNEDEPAIIVGDYTINIDSNELTGEYTSARIRLEPVELTVSDAFRAAVSKTAPKSEGGGGSGGGALVVNVTDGDGGTFVADKSMSEVLSAIASDNPVLCKYNTLISFFTKDEDYPEVYASVSTIAQAIYGQGHDGLSVRMFYFEYAEDGTFSGSKSEAIISI